MYTKEKELELEKIFFGMTSANKDLLNSESAQKSVGLIQGAELSSDPLFTSKAINPKRISKVAKKDFTMVFPNVNRQVLYMSEEDLLLVQRQNIRNRYSNKILIEKLNDITEPMDIFEIPLHYEQDQERYGVCNFPKIVRDNAFYLRNIPIAVSWIEIAGPPDYMSVIAYAHETTHPLLARYRGVIEDYYLSEVLPITIEQIMALECDETEELLRKMQLFRMQHYQTAIKQIKANQDDPKEIHHIHVISGLIANCVFDRYYNETSTGRNYMLGEIQSVLNGEKSQNQFLQEQAISLSTSEAVTVTENTLQKCLVKTNK